MMYNEVKALFEEYYRNHNYSGSGMIKKGDEVLFGEAYGYAHRGFKLKNTLGTMFDTASITKLFTSVAVLQLVDMGMLRLEDRIRDIVDLDGTKIPNDVSIDHLLTHTSGIADDADEEAGEKYEELFISKPNYSIRNCIDFIPQFAYKEPNFKAGTGVRYNNCAYVLLGLAIEKASGHGYRKWITENIFKKCGMANSSFCAKDDGDAVIAEGYYSCLNEESKRIEWRKNIYSYPPVGTADGGAFSTVMDLDRFIRAIINGELLSERMTKDIMKPQAAVDEKYDWGRIINGYGFHFLYTNDGKLVRIYKEGSNPGVAAMLAYYPMADTTSIILGNQDCNVWELHYKVEEVILRTSV